MWKMISWCNRWPSFIFFVVYNFLFLFLFSFLLEEDEPADKVFAFFLFAAGRRSSFLLFAGGGAGRVLSSLQVWGASCQLVTVVTIHWCTSPPSRPLPPPLPSFSSLPSTGSQAPGEAAPPRGSCGYALWMAGSRPFQCLLPAVMKSLVYRV